MAFVKSGFDGFNGPCGDVKLTLEDRVNAIEEAGWRQVTVAKWAPSRDMLEEALIAADVKPGDDAVKWAKAKKDASDLVDLALLTASERKDRGASEFQPYILMPKLGANAILMVFVQPLRKPSEASCVYAGPVPKELSGIVAANKLNEGLFDKSALPKKPDPFIQQYSFNITTKSGEPVNPPTFVSVFTAEAATYLGHPPKSPATIVIYATPLSKWEKLK